MGLGDWLLLLFFFYISFTSLSFLNANKRNIRATGRVEVEKKYIYNVIKTTTLSHVILFNELFAGRFFFLLYSLMFRVCVCVPLNCCWSHCIAIGSDRMKLEPYLYTFTCVVVVVDVELCACSLAWHVTKERPHQQPVFLRAIKIRGAHTATNNNNNSQPYSNKS